MIETELVIETELNMEFGTLLDSIFFVDHSAGHLLSSFSAFGPVYQWARRRADQLCAFEDSRLVPLWNSKRMMFLLEVLLQRFGLLRPFDFQARLLDFHELEAQDFQGGLSRNLPDLKPGPNFVIEPLKNSKLMMFLLEDLTGALA